MSKGSDEMLNDDKRVEDYWKIIGFKRPCKAFLRMNRSFYQNKISIIARSVLLLSG
jgi:hypothetical protein